MPADTKTDFGFRKVDTEEKAGMVRGVFTSVAARYDVMNDLMSGGVHRIWKSVLIDRLTPQPGRTLLDMAGGTGDVAEAYLARAATRPGAETRPPAKAIVCDVNADMLYAGLARARARARTNETQSTLEAANDAARVCGDAENIPLPDKTVDAYTISFGIRNVTHIEQALAEAYRVLKRGGVFACLEFSHPITEGLQKAYDAYSFNVIPWLGEKVVDDRESYQYLVESIRRFPSQEAFADMIADAGFKSVRYENLTGGIAALHLGAKI
ncbi:MAG: class I SAM-dependent methyltransferase [Pseudomonadota bacterium]